LPTVRFEDALQEIARRFAMEIVALIRTTTVQELTTLALPMEAAPAPVAAPEKPATPAKRRGRPPKAKTVATPPVESVVAVEPVAAEPAPPAEKTKKKRNWPICSVEGCGKNFYAPSAKKRLCYAHHIEAGGKESPLLAARRKKAPATKKAAPTPAAPPKPAKTRTAKVAKPTEAPAAEPKPKRAWPTCTVEGCGKNVYMPSGARKMCYQHNIEHGGKPTPLSKVNKARKKAAAAPNPEKKPRTVRRKKT
jgi:hypothetical protein